MTYINMSSVKLYVKLQNFFTFCKVAACFVVIGVGLYHLSLGEYHRYIETSSFQLLFILQVIQVI